jgi:putative glycosyl hydrolase
VTKQGVLAFGLATLILGSGTAHAAQPVTTGLGLTANSIGLPDPGSLLPGQKQSSPSSVQLRLDPNDASKAQVTGMPSGTKTLHIARMQTSSGCPCTYVDVSAPASLPWDYQPPADQPVVDMLARDASGNDLGTWYSATSGGSRIVTTPPSSSSSPPPPPPPPPATTVIGLNYGNYGSGGASDVRNAVSTARFDTDLGASAFSTAKAAGLKFDVLDSGPYTTSGVCGINASSWVSSALSWYSANTDPTQSPYFEVLNEPGGTWYWGSSANSTANGSCYRSLLQQTWTAFHNKYGTGAPKILGSVDGSGGLTFGQNWWQSSAASYVDGVTVHPYGGTGSTTSSAQGNRQRVTDAHNLTGEPVYITEVGWPTATSCSPTGDSLQWSESDQATNITNFADWARGTGYVPLVTFFTYRDYGSCDWYGVEHADGTKKPAYSALQAEAAK